MENSCLMNTYKQKITLEKGIGCYVFDDNGNKYLDLTGGIATCTLGHANPHILEAISMQASKMITATNLFYNRPQEELAKILCKISGLSRCFFSNSGTEAMECAIKLAKKHTKKHKFIAMKNGFHGRSTGSLSATWNSAYKTPFEPLLSGFQFVEYGNINELQDAISSDTAAVILEPIQGEAGVLVPPNGYLQEVRRITKEKNVLLILDEIQTGNGRTGTFFCFEQEGILPDIVTLAKGLANGLPIGATLSGEGIDFSPGEHGSTFGGNSFCCAVAKVTVEKIEELIESVKEKSRYFFEELQKIEAIKEVRGKGLMMGFAVLNGPDVAEKLAGRGILVNAPNAKTIRLLPPLVISKEEIDFAISAFKNVLSKEEPQ